MANIISLEEEYDSLSNCFVNMSKVPRFVVIPLEFSVENIEIERWKIRSLNLLYSEFSCESLASGMKLEAYFA